MSVAMHVEVGFLRERLSTNCALVRPFTAVYSAVNFHIVLKAKTFATNIALVRLFPRMDNAVSTQLAGICADNFAILIVTMEKLLHLWFYFMRLHVAF